MGKTDRSAEWARPKKKDPNSNCRHVTYCRGNETGTRLVNDSHMSLIESRPPFLSPFLSRGLTIYGSGKRTTPCTFPRTSDSGLQRCCFDGFEGSRSSTSCESARRCGRSSARRTSSPNAGSRFAVAGGNGFHLIKIDSRPCWRPFLVERRYTSIHCCRADPRQDATLVNGKRPGIGGRGRPSGRR